MTVVIACCPFLSHHAHCSNGHSMYTHLPHRHTQTNTNIIKNNSPSPWWPLQLPGHLHQPNIEATIAVSNSADVPPQDDDFVEPPHHSFPSSDTVLLLSTARRLRRASGRMPLSCLPGKGALSNLPRRIALLQSIKRGVGEVSAPSFLFVLHDLLL